MLVKDVFEFFQYVGGCQVVLSALIAANEFYYLFFKHSDLDLVVGGPWFGEPETIMLKVVVEDLAHIELERLAVVLLVQVDKVAKEVVRAHCAPVPFRLIELG